MGSLRGKLIGGVVAVFATAAFLGVVSASASASVIVYRCGNPAELCRINPDGTGQTQLTSDGASAAYHGASLDLAANRMVFTRDTASLYAADGNAQNAVGPISTFSEMAKISADGSTAVDAEYFPSLGAYFLCTFSTSNPGSGDYGRTCEGTGRFPAWTPNGQIVASILKNGHDEICLYDASGCATDLAVDPTADLDEAAVSPDGKTLAVVAVQPGGSDPAGGHIALYSMSTGQLIRNLTSGTIDETPAWSPDGRGIVFSRGESLYVIAASGQPGSETLLVRGGDTPTWGGPAGQHDGRPGGATSVAAAVPAKLGLGALLKHGLSIQMQASPKVAVAMLLVLDRSTSRRLKIGKSATVLGQVTGLVSRNRTLTATVKPKFDAKLKRVKRFTLHLVLVIQNAAGNQTQRVFDVAIRR